jgi:hypothetical protein
VPDYSCHENNQNAVRTFGRSHNVIFELTPHSLKNIKTIKIRIFSNKLRHNLFKKDSSTFWDESPG